MGLEAGTLIKDLVATNPVPGDKRRFGDDHLRLLKAVLQNQFVNVKEQLTPSDVEFNYVAGVTAPIQTQLNDKLESADLDLTPYGQLAVRNLWTRIQQISPISLGNVSGTVNAEMSLATTYRFTLVGDTTLTVSNVAEGQEITLKVTQGANPPAILTLPGNAHFPSGVLPQPVTNIGEYDIYSGKILDGFLIFGFLGNLGAI